MEWGGGVHPDVVFGIIPPPLPLRPQKSALKAPAFGGVSRSHGPLLLVPVPVPRGRVLCTADSGLAGPHWSDANAGGGRWHF